MSQLHIPTMQAGQPHRHRGQEGASEVGVESHTDWHESQCKIFAGEIAGIIQEGEMPPAIYLPMHPEAQLTAAEKQQLITGLTNSLK